MLASRLAHRLDFLPIGFWIATLSSVFYFFAIQITFPITPLFIEQELQASKTFIGTAVLAVSVVEVLFRLPMGQWTDRWGKRNLLLVGAALNIVFLVLTALSQDTPLFLLSRVAHGLSLATYITCAKIYISDIVPLDRAGEAQGINTSAFALALIFGPLTGEALKNAFDFRTAFLVGAGIATLAWAILFLLPSKDDFPLTASPSIIKGLKAVLVLRGGWAAIFAAMGGAIGFVTFFIYFPTYVETLALESKVPAFMSEFVLTVAFTVFALANLVVLPLAGRYSDRQGRTAALLPGLLIFVPGLIFLALARHYVLIYVAIIVVSVGFSFFRAMMDALMQDACERPIRGSGMAVLFSVWSASIGLHSQIMGWIIDRYSFEAMYLYSIGFALLFGVLAIGLSRTAEPDRATLYKAEFPLLPPT